MTTNDLNRRVVADWLRGTSEECQLRSVLRRNRWLPSGTSLLLRWRLTRVGVNYRINTTTSTTFYGASRAEATAKAAEWILRKGWEVKDG